MAGTLVFGTISTILFFSSIWQGLWQLSRGAWPLFFPAPQSMGYHLVKSMEKNTVDKSLKYQHGLKIFPLHKKMPGSICSCGQEFIAIQKCAKDMPRLSPPINHYPVMESHSMNSGNHIDATNMSLDLQLEKDESSIFDSAWATLGEEALAKF